jgi:hypothetical protein
MNESEKQFSFTRAALSTSGRAKANSYQLYLASLAGRVTVVKAGGDKPEILHQADFGDRILATPALVGEALYLRTQKRLYAFGDKPVAQ